MLPAIKKKVKLSTSSENMNESLDQNFPLPLSKVSNLYTKILGRHTSLILICIYLIGIHSNLFFRGVLSTFPFLSCTSTKEHIKYMMSNPARFASAANKSNFPTLCLRKECCEALWFSFFNTHCAKPHLNG